MKFTFLLLSITFATLSFSQTVKACFLGNSYTFYNDMPGIVASLANADGFTLIKDQNTPGGYTLQGHSTNGTSLNVINSDEWDFVVLQDQSQLPSFPHNQVVSDVYPYAANLCDSIRAANECAAPLFFNTWGRRDGDSQWDSINTFDKMNQRLFNAYGHMADVNSGMRSPVGIAFDHVHNDGAATVTFTNLYAGDGSHPSIYGSYLTACLFYEIMFETSVDGNTFYPSGVTSNEAAYLQGVAHHVLTNVDSVQIDFRQPSANFSFVQNGFDFTFTNESSHDFEWMWDFGDGNTSMDENPSHTYLNGGTFDVTLTATNCAFTDDTTIQVSVGTFGFEELDQSAWSITQHNQQVDIISESKQNLSIYSVDGRLVKAFEPFIGTKSIHLNKGIYIITDGRRSQRFVQP